MKIPATSTTVLDHPASVLRKVERRMHEIEQERIVAHKDHPGTRWAMAAIAADAFAEARWLACSDWTAITGRIRL